MTKIADAYWISQIESLERDVKLVFIETSSSLITVATPSMATTSLSTLSTA